MGWKAVRDYYGIEHIVQVTEAGICIGSPYIHDIIVVSMEGEITKPYPQDRDRGWSVNDQLERYCDEMKADPAKLRELVTQPDTFGETVTVYTYDGGDILAMQAEEVGWPNLTTEGRIQYENTFSTDRAQVVKWAIRNAEAGIDLGQDRLERARIEEAEAREYLNRRNRDLAKLIASVDRSGEAVETPQSGSTEGESAVTPKAADAQTPASQPSSRNQNI